MKKTFLLCLLLTSCLSGQNKEINKTLEETNSMIGDIAKETEKYKEIQEDTSSHFSESKDGNSYEISGELSEAFDSK